jgi:ABC-type branched-subunit amino acid transport system substrate-binding protein
MSSNRQNPPGTDGRPARGRIGRLAANFVALVVAALTVAMAVYLPDHIQDIDRSLARLLLRNDKTTGAPIKIGFAGALGRAGDIAILNGAQIAVDEINAAGGLVGRPLTIETFNDLGDEDNATSVPNRSVRPRTSSR